MATLIQVGDKFERNCLIWVVIRTRPGGKVELFCKEESRFMDRYHREVKDWKRVSA